MMSPLCPRCRSDMETGFLLDQAQQRQIALWVEGEPERSIWEGLRIRGRRQIRTMTYRCRSCGFLESYAREE